MQHFKEIDYAAEFCARPDATLYLQNLTEVDTEFSRWRWQCQSAAECLVSHR